MKAISSEIQLENFTILQSHYNYIPSKRKIKNPQDLFKDLDIDIDFTHQVNEDHSIRVFTKIAVNHGENPKAGYQLFIEGVAVFSFLETENLSEKEQNNLKFYSTVNILIGYLRNSLASLTTASPLGQYLLPPININDLFRKKSAQTNTENK